MIYLVRLSVQHYLYNYQWKYIYVLWLAAYLNSWRQSLQWRPLFSIICLTVSVKFQLYNGMYFFSLRLFCFLHSTFLYFLSICMFISKICSRRNIIICCKYKNIRYISSTRRNKLIKMSSAAINSVSFFFFFLDLYQHHLRNHVPFHQVCEYYFRACFFSNMYALSLWIIHHLLIT